MFPGMNFLFAQPTHWLGLPNHLRPPVPSESPGAPSPSPSTSDGFREDHSQISSDMPAREVGSGHEVAPPHSSPLPGSEEAPSREMRGRSAMFEEAIPPEDLITTMTGMSDDHDSSFNQPLVYSFSELNSNAMSVPCLAPDDPAIITPDDLIEDEGVMRTTTEAETIIDTMDTAIQDGNFPMPTTGFDEVMTGAATQGDITTSEDQDITPYETEAMVTTPSPSVESCIPANDAAPGKPNATSAQKLTALVDTSAIQDLVIPALSGGNTSFSGQISTQETMAPRSERDLEKLAKRAGMHLITKSQVAEAKIHSSLENRTEPAQFDGNKYTIDVRITSDTAFTINTRDFRVGEHSGRLVMVVEPTPLRTLDFLGFPPEIQNMIYHLLFVRHGCSIYMNPGVDDDDTSTRMRGVWDPKRGYSKAYKDEPNIINGTNLLATCSEINKPASSVLYGYNDFEFGQTTDLTSFLAPMRKETASHIRGLNVGWLLPRDFKKAAKLLPKCANLQKLHLNLKYMTVPPFRSEHQPEKVVPPFKAILKQMYDHNKVNFFARVTWASPYPARNATEEQKIEKKAFNMKIKELILAQVMPQPKRITPAKASATSNNTGVKNTVAKKSAHNSNHG